jgi:hypothetical protein
MKKFHRLVVLTRGLMASSGPWKSYLEIEKEIFCYLFVFYSYFSTANCLFAFVMDLESSPDTRVF